MNVVRWPEQVQPSPEPEAGAGSYSTKPRRPTEEKEIVDAVVVSEDIKPRSLRLRVKIPEDINIHAIVGTAVAAMALGFMLLVVALVGVLVAMEMLALLINEPL